MKKKYNLAILFLVLSATFSIAQNIGIGINNPLDKLHVNGITRTTGINLVGNSAIETGFGLAGKETNAGKIGYGLFTPNTLDIIGAGNAYLDRKIRFWAEGGSTFEGKATFNGNIGIGNLSPAQKLEVSGKIKIADDLNTPTAGTIRYNATLQDFEGYNGTEWKSFTKPINTEYWGVLNRVVAEINPTTSISNGVAIPKCMFSDNYMALSYKANSSSNTVTRFYKWQSGAWVFMNEINADIIHKTTYGNLIKGRMTDDWFLFGNESLNNVSIYRRNGSLWQFHSTIAEPSLSEFGSYYDIDGSKLVITTTESPSNIGAIFVHNFNGTSWVLQQTITDPTPNTNNAFGTKVILKNNYLATSYGNSSSSVYNTTRIFYHNGTSFVFNSSITGRELENIFFEGTSIRIKIINFADLFNPTGGIYKIGGTGLWELIPNTLNMDAIANYALDYASLNSSPNYTLKKNVAGNYNDLCLINYSTIAGSENFGGALLNTNCVIIPSSTGYKIFNKP